MRVRKAMDKVLDEVLDKVRREKCWGGARMPVFWTVTASSPLPLSSAAEGKGLIV